MPRKKLTPLEVAQKAAAELGLELPDLSQLDVDRREADATILYLESPEKFRTATCRQCDRQFATNYSAVAMCSDQCRIVYLRSIGIEWNLSKTQAERWSGRIPLVVPPPALVLASEVLESVKLDHVAHL